MSTDRIIWSEGLFIQPQHFQQETLYNDYRFHSYQKLAGGEGHFYGLSRLSIDQDSLMFGKIKLNMAQGIMPDGTLIDIPNKSRTPDFIDINASSQIGEIVYLCLPLNQRLTREHQIASSAVKKNRYLEEIEEIDDIYADESNFSRIATAKLSFQLLLESDDRSQYVSLPIARITDVRADNSLMLDKEFSPPALALSASNAIHVAIESITDLLLERAKNLAQKLGDASTQATANVVDHLMLACMNRFYPVFFACSRNPDTPMHTIYQWLAMLSGELNTYVSESKISDQVPLYNHLRPDESIWPLIRNLRIQLSTVLYSKALRLQIESKEFGVYNASITDRHLLDSAEFLLGLNVDATDTHIISTIKVSSIEKIQELINYQLPGIPLRMLTLAPRNIPYNPNFVYFKVDKNAKSWGQMQGASGFALHVPGKQTKLELQFWAVRGDEV